MAPVLKLNECGLALVSDDGVPAGFFLSESHANLKNVRGTFIPLRTSHMSVSRRIPCRQYTFVSYDDVSTIYNTIADELRSSAHWVELSPSRGGVNVDLVLAPCHGRGLMWDDIGRLQPQLVNYLRGSRGMTLKVTRKTCLNSGKSK